LCAALQVINHLQDCATDYRDLNRVYLAEDALAAANTDIRALAAPSASPALRSVIIGMARRTEQLLSQSAGLAGRVRDRRLSYEVALIQRLAEDLTRRLIARDPLSERVHHRPLEVLGLAILAGKDQIAGRRRPSQERARSAE
jgi:phytoene/squalene synthetase